MTRHALACEWLAVAAVLLALLAWLLWGMA